MPEAIDYYTTHASDYDAQVTSLDDLSFYLDLATDRTVEIGAGTGRLTIPIAQAGHRVIGIEPFVEMLTIARRKVSAAGLLDRVDLVQGDMRSFTLGAQAPLVLIPGSGVHAQPDHGGSAGDAEVLLRRARIGRPAGDRRVQSEPGAHCRR